MGKRKFLVECWCGNLHGEWYFDGLPAARARRSELLAALPSGWEVTLREVEL